MRPTKMTRVIHFGYGGRQLIVNRTLGDDYSEVVLPDGRIVSLVWLVNSFPTTGRLSIPPQPLRVEEVATSVENPVRAGFNKSSKNFLVQRLGFYFSGQEFRVGPEAYGDCLVRTAAGFEPMQVLIRLPGENSDNFVEVDEWTSPGSPLAILSVRETEEVYLLGSNGKPIIDRKGKPIYRKYVWATGPH